METTEKREGATEERGGATEERGGEKISFDLIVVGAGLAGSTAAAIAARNGLKVALIERGQNPGGKNFFGGAVYTNALEEIYPDFWDRKPPLEPGDRGRLLVPVKRWIGSDDRARGEAQPQTDRCARRFKSKIR